MSLQSLIDKFKSTLSNTIWKHQWFKRSLSLAVYLVLIGGVFHWQTRNMLETDQPSPLGKITLADMEHGTFTYNFANGNKKTLLYFFAPWCSICHLSIDNTETFKAKDDLNVLIIALDWKSREEVESFLAQHNLSSPVLLGTNQIAEKFQVSGFPSYYLIDQEGVIQAKSMGYTTALGMRAVSSIH